MIINRYITLVFLTLFFGLSGRILSGQTTEKTIYQKVKIHLEGKGLRPLAALGVEVEHGYIRSQDVLINFYSLEEVKQVVEAGFKVDVLQEDAVAHYIRESKKVKPVPLGLELRDKSCEGAVLKYDIPVNFKYGSMGSYLTFSEIMAELDLMRAKYPQLITRKDSIDFLPDFKTKQNNFVQWVKISDNPSVNESDEEQLILYTALYHAREPMSMMQMIYFMWYIQLIWNINYR